MGVSWSHLPLCADAHGSIHMQEFAKKWRTKVAWLRSYRGNRRTDGHNRLHYASADAVVIEWWDAGMVICLERGADLHMAQLMPLPLTVSCFSKIQIGFTFLVPAHLGIPGKRAIKRVCVTLSLICSYVRVMIDNHGFVGNWKRNVGSSVRCRERRTVKGRNKWISCTELDCWVLRR